MRRGSEGPRRPATESCKRHGAGYDIICRTEAETRPGETVGFGRAGCGVHNSFTPNVARAKLARTGVRRKANHQSGISQECRAHSTKIRNRTSRSRKRPRCVPSSISPAISWVSTPSTSSPTATTRPRFRSITSSRSMGGRTASSSWSPRSRRRPRARARPRPPWGSATRSTASARRP